MKQVELQIDLQQGLTTLTAEITRSHKEVATIFGQVEQQISHLRQF